MTPRPTTKARRGFGRTWWGTAWVEALEERARIDFNRLPRGRTYARSGRVGPLTVEPGEVRAAVRGSRETHYAVRIRVQTLDKKAWDEVLNAMAGEASHLAALLDGELPPGVVADVADTGIDLLPGPGDVRTRCTCPDWASPCKHAAAVCYLIADVIDDDPFALLVLRGRTRHQVLAALRARRSAGLGIASDEHPRFRSSALRPADEGVEARIVWADATDGSERPLPVIPPPPPRPGHPAMLPVDPPDESGLDADALRALAADAARRAWSLLVGESDGGLGLTADQDLARRAAAASMDELDHLARRAGIDPRRLFRLRKAWQVGGADAIGPAVARTGRDWRTDPNGRLQLRPAPDGSWYPFEPDGDGWIVSGPPVSDPSVLLDPVARRVPFWRRGMTEKERRAYMFGGGWFQDLQTMHVASPLRLLVVAEMTEVGDGEGLLRGMRVGELAERCREAALRTPSLAGEAGAAVNDPAAWNRIWRPNLTAWSRARQGSPRWFRVAADQIEPLLPVAPGCEREFTAMTRDIVLDRLHAITIT